MSKVCQIRLSDDVYNVIEYLMKITNAKNKASVIRSALSYYKWIIDEVKKGNQIIAVNKDTVDSINGTKVVLPDLFCELV